MHRFLNVQQWSRLIAVPALAFVIGCSSTSISWNVAPAPPQKYRATHVWVRVRGNWRLVAAHVSQVAQP